MRTGGYFIGAGREVQNGCVGIERVEAGLDRGRIVGGTVARRAAIGFHVLPVWERAYEFLRTTRNSGSLNGNRKVIRCGPGLADRGEQQQQKPGQAASGE